MGFSNKFMFQRRIDDKLMNKTVTKKALLNVCLKNAPFKEAGKPHEAFYLLRR